MDQNGTSIPMRTRAQEICSRLMIRPYIPKADFKDLVVDENLRRDVETRLRAVGLVLVDNYYSKFFAVRLADEIERDASLSWAANFHLEKPAIALLVVLWSKLVFPKRAAQERHETPGDNVRPLFPGSQPPPADADIEQYTSEAALRAELGKKCGGAKLPIYLGQLRRMGFIEYSRLDHITEGPLLDLLIDGPQMAIKLKNSALWDVLGRKGPPPYAGMTNRVDTGHPELDDAPPADDELLAAPVDDDLHDAEPEPDDG